MTSNDKHKVMTFGKSVYLLKFQLAPHFINLIVIIILRIVQIGNAVVLKLSSTIE